MNHVLIGSAVPYLVLLAWYLRRGARASPLMLLLGPCIIGACGLWAVIPDLPRALGQFELYALLAEEPLMDIFFFHHTIDRIETDSAWYPVGFVLLGGSLLAVAWRELRLTEKRAWPT
jgi:hypothetical protein